MTNFLNPDNYRIAQVSAKIDWNENIQKHFDTENSETLLRKASDRQLTYLSDMIEYKKMSKVNRLLVQLGFKRKEIFNKMTEEKSAEM